MRSIHEMLTRVSLIYKERKTFNFASTIDIDVFRIEIEIYKIL